jgi:Na+/proline symporter
MNFESNYKHMSITLISTVIILYFSALLLISWYTSKGADAESFFIGKKESPWYLVAFGMIGTSLSGVTFISVPGSVGVKGFEYFQIVMGYMIGYFIIGTVLMPLYYRMGLISIYSYLESRLGYWSYKTGALYFLVSRTIGSALRLYLASAVLHLFVFSRWDIPFLVTVAVTILLIWVYTFKGGIKTIIWTDSFQTIFLVASLIICIITISQHFQSSISDLSLQVWNSAYSKIFHFEDALAGNYFWKQLAAGAFLALVMTGLDQDLMQKNLSCKNIKDAQKNMLWFSVILLFVNFLFLFLGALLYLYSNSKGLPIPERTDFLFPELALNHFGTVAGIFFLLGITASSYASSDSALTALTTSFCIDFLNIGQYEEKESKKYRTLVHVGFSVLFFLIIILFNWLNNSSVIDTVLKAAVFTYGPLLGLFFFGILTTRKITDHWTPYLAVLAPILTYVIEIYTKEWTGYIFSYELLLINGGIMFVGLWLSGLKKN